MTNYPSGFVGPIRSGDTIGKKKPDVVVDPRTGKTWGSVESYVKDPKKYGGGSRNRSQEIARNTAAQAAAKAAEQKRQAEIKRQQEEAKKLADKLQEEKQSKIDSQKISGQINTASNMNTPTDLVISSYNKEDRFTTPGYRQSFPASAGMALKSIGSNIVGSLFGRDTLKPVSESTEVFEYSEGFKRDKVSYTTPLFGTAQTDPVTGKVVTGDVTFGDIQRGVEERRDLKLLSAETKAEDKAKKITSNLQSKVDKGEITLTDAKAKAKEEFDVLNKEYKTTQENIFGSEKDVKGVFQRTGSARKIANLAPDLIAVGASAAVGVVNPVAGAAIATGYFTGKGIVGIAYNPTYKEVGLQGGLYAGVGKDDKGKLSILEPTELDVKFTNIKREAATSLIFGAAAGVGLVGAYSKGIIAQELVELGQAPVKVKSITSVKGDTSYDLIKGFQSKGGLTREFQITGKVIKQGDKSFILPSGKGFSTTSGTFDWGLYKGYGKTYYAGGDIFSVGSKGSTTAVKDGYLTLGKGTIEPKISFGGTFQELTPNAFSNIGKTLKIGGKSEIQFFAGASKKIPSSSSTADYYKSVTGGVNYQRVSSGGFDAFGLGKELDINTFGIHKVLKTGSSSIDDIYRSGGSSIIKQVKGFGGTSVPDSLIKQFSGSISGVQAKTITKTSYSIISPAFLPSVYSGTGQYEKTGGSGFLYGQKQNSIGFSANLKQPKIVFKPVDVSFKIGKTSIFGTRIKQGGITRQVSAQSQISNLISSGNVRQNLITGQRINQRTIQDQVLTQEPIVQVPLVSPGFLGGGFGGGLPPFGFIKPKMAQFGVSRRGGQKGKQKTAFQTSFTGSILKIRGTGLAPGALSVRGILEPKKKSKKKKFSIL